MYTPAKAIDYTDRVAFLCDDIRQRYVYDTGGSFSYTNYVTKTKYVWVKIPPKEVRPFLRECHREPQDRLASRCWVSPRLAHLMDQCEI